MKDEFFSASAKTNAPAAATNRIAENHGGNRNDFVACLDTTGETATSISLCSEKWIPFGGLSIREMKHIRKLYSQLVLNGGRPLMCSATLANSSRFSGSVARLLTTRHLATSLQAFPALFECRPCKPPVADSRTTQLMLGVFGSNAGSILAISPQGPKNAGGPFLGP